MLFPLPFWQGMRVKGSIRTVQSSENPGTAPITFRRIEPRDDQPVRDLYQLVQVDHATSTRNPAILDYVRSHVSEVFATDFAEPHAYYNLPGHAFWVAESAGKLVGMAGIEKWPGEAGVARLRHVMVHPSWRRFGIATTILGSAESWCAENGYTSVRLATTDANDVAVAIYLRRGYAEIDRKRGQAAMTITMEKILHRSPP